MKWLLARIGLPKAIGLYLDEDTITLSRVVATPFGPVEITRQSEVLGGEPLGVVIERLVRPLLGSRRFRRTTICVGVPSQKVYFSTRPVHATTGDSSPHVLLREALRSPNVAVGDMAVDVVKTESDAREVASIAACDKNYLNEILDGLGQLDIRPWRTEPAPCALLRLAALRHRTRRGEKVVLRLFLSDSQVLSVLVVDKMPLLWRYTQLVQGKEATSLVTAARSLLATSKDCGVESPLDAVMVHGRVELKRLLDLDWMEEQMDTPIRWFGEPILDNAQIALGLAQGGLDKDLGGFDLGRSSKPRPSLWQVFPWREATIQSALVGLMALFLAYTYWTLQETKQSFEVTAAASASSKSQASKQDLIKEKKEMEARVGAVREFLATRVLWTSCLRDLTMCVPKDMYLTSVQGTCGLRSMRKSSRSKTKKSFVLRGAVEIPRGVSTPHEIDRLLVALRSNPTLQAEFPAVALDEMKRVESRADLPSIATFSVVCLADPSKAAQAAKGGKKAKKK